MTVEFYIRDSDEESTLTLTSGNALMLVRSLGYDFDDDFGSMPARDLAERCRASLARNPAPPREQWPVGLHVGYEPPEQSLPRRTFILLRMAERAGDDGVVVFA